MYADKIVEVFFQVFVEQNEVICTYFWIFGQKFHLSPEVFLLIQGLVRGSSNVLFWLHCIVKQNIWEASYDASYEALNE